MVENCILTTTEGVIPTQYQLEQFAKSLMLPFTFNDLKNKRYYNWANYLHELGHWAICHPTWTNRLIRNKRLFYEIPCSIGGLDDVCVEVWCHLVLIEKRWQNPIFDDNFCDKHRWYTALNSNKNIKYTVNNGFYLGMPSTLKKYNEAFDKLIYWEINPLISKYRPLNEKLNPQERQYKNGRVYYTFPSYPVT